MFPLDFTVWFRTSSITLDFESDEKMNTNISKALQKMQRRLKTAVVVASVFVFQPFNMSAFANSAEISDEPVAWISLAVPIVLILGAAAAATFILRRWKRSVSGPGGPLQLIHVIAVGPRERLAVVKIGTRYLVVGITPNNINRIAELSDIQDDAAGTSSAPRDDAAEGRN